jgi:hypothetical protein
LGAGATGIADGGVVVWGGRGWVGYVGFCGFDSMGNQVTCAAGCDEVRRVGINQIELDFDINELQGVTYDPTLDSISLSRPKLR